VYVVGCTIRIYYDARTYERQTADCLMDFWTLNALMASLFIYFFVSPNEHSLVQVKIR